MLKKIQPILEGDRLLRLRQIIGDRKANPPIEPIIPISKSSWWAGVASGKYPKPIKLSERVTVWKASDIEKFIDKVTGEVSNHG